jgi:hypothetical protein
MVDIIITVSKVNPPEPVYTLASDTRPGVTDQRTWRIANSFWRDALMFYPDCRVVMTHVPADRSQPPRIMKVHEPA